MKRRWWVEDWRQGWQWLSVQAAAALVLLQLLQEQVLPLFGFAIPAKWLPWVNGGLGLAIIVCRFLNQQMNEKGAKEPVLQGYDLGRGDRTAFAVVSGSSPPPSVSPTMFIAPFPSTGPAPIRDEDMVAGVATAIHTGEPVVWNSGGGGDYAGGGASGSWECASPSSSSDSGSCSSDSGSSSGGSD